MTVGSLQLDSLSVITWRAALRGGNPAAASGSKSPSKSASTSKKASKKRKADTDEDEEVPQKKPRGRTKKDDNDDDDVWDHTDAEIIGVLRLDEKYSLTLLQRLPKSRGLRLCTTTTIFRCNARRRSTRRS